MLPWLLSLVLALLLLALLLKLCLLRSDLKALAEQFTQRIEQDSPNPLFLPSRDPALRQLAVVLDRQLRQLRRARLRYENGDRELKAAVTNISHDLRTPLTAICGYLDLLGREPLSESAARYLSLVENRTEAMKQLTEELFRYSVILSTQELEVESVCINSVLEESIAAFYAALTARGIQPQIQICESKVERELNREALGRVFSNILNNALKYSDGDLDIRLGCGGEIQFSNTASGLNEVQVGKLFDRFFTVEAARNSGGLGLAISKTLVEKMGGSITAGLNNGVLSIQIKFQGNTA